MTVGATSGAAGGAAGADQPGGGKDFSAAVASSGLTVNQGADTIDTGRYLITGSSDKQGDLTIHDKQTGSDVEVWGDPHLVTSDGDHADFQSHGLTIKLADGTTVQIKPTELQGGVSHIDQVAVTKDDSTSIMSGFYQSGPGGVTTAAAQAGNAFQVGQGFDDYDDTVLTAGADTVSDLSFSDGVKLVSKGHEMLLDGKGGGVDAFLDERNPITNYSSVMDVEASATAAGGVTGPVAPKEGEAAAITPTDFAPAAGGQVAGLSQQSQGEAA